MQNSYLHAMGITKWVERDYIDPAQLIDVGVLDSKIPETMKSIASHINDAPLISRLDTNLEAKKAKKISASEHQNIKEMPQILTPDIDVKNMMDSRKSAHDKWVNIKSLIQNCYGCERSKTRIHPIFGKGTELSNLNTPYDVMFILQSPSREEDLQGDMFVGPMKLLFSQLMDALKLSSRFVFATHASKCRESTDYIENNPQCFAYLTAQVSLLKPKVIVLMGVESPVSVSQEIQRYADLNGTEVIQSISPYDVLSRPSLKKQLWLELKMITASFDTSSDAP